MGILDNMKKKDERKMAKSSVAAQKNHGIIETLRRAVFGREAQVGEQGGKRMLKKASIKFDKELFKRSVLNNVKILYRRTLEEEIQH